MATKSRRAGRRQGNPTGDFAGDCRRHENRRRQCAKQIELAQLVQVLKRRRIADKLSQAAPRREAPPHLNEMCRHQILPTAPERPVWAREKVPAFAVDLDQLREEIARG